MTPSRPPTRRSRMLALVLISVVLSATVLVSPAAARTGTTTAAAESGPCTGLPPGGTWICDGIMSVIEWFVGGVQELVQGMFLGVVEFIVDTPAPYHNGEMAFFKSPDNAPWTTLYDLYLTKTLPIGIALWALIVLLVQFTRLFTHTAEGEYQRTRLTRRAAFGFLMLIAWWPVGAFVLHMAGALTTAIAPSGEQMVGTINEFFGNIGGGLITAVLLYFSSGVVAFLLLLVFLTRHVAIYVLMPLMPVLISLWIIDEGPMKYVASVAESIGGMFVPFVFMTLPTAAILLVGYSIQDALRQSLGSTAVIPGVSGAATSAYAVILFMFWVMALVAPLFVLFGGRAGLPLAYLTAGYLAGRGMRGAARRGAKRFWRNRPGFSWSRGGGEAGSPPPKSGRSDQLPAVGRSTALEPKVGEDDGGGVGDGSAGPGGSTGPLAKAPGWRRTATGGGPKTGAERTRFGAESTSSPWDDVSGGIDEERVRARITPETGFAEQLPEDRRYSFGYSREGEFQQVGQQNRLTKSDVLSRKYPEFAESRLYNDNDKSDMYLRDDQGQLYDVTPRWHYDQQHTRFDEEAREVVFQAQNYNSTETTERANTQWRN